MSEHKEITVTERVIACRKCGSTDVSKYGFYKGSQYYICKTCGTKFAGKESYYGRWHSKDLIVKAITYYYGGMSYEHIINTFEDVLNVEVSKATVWRWVTKYSKMVNDYVLTLKPKLSDVWIADETVVDIWGSQYWFWDIIDTETRFLIASHLSRTRTEDDARKLFYMAKLRSKTRPKLILTDKLGQYNWAFNKVFFTPIKARKVLHLTSHGFDSPTNINQIERFHGTVKQRTKVMRDLKTKGYARTVLDGFVTHYNFFMEHDALSDKTPAEVSGIGNGIKNWDDLIRLAQAAPKRNPEVVMEWENLFLPCGVRKVGLHQSET